MKKITSIVLLALFLFNLFGYRVLFYYTCLHSAKLLEVALDKEWYDESELIALTIPVDNPYQNDSNEFERVDGEVNIDGKIYRYVKRKITGNQLILLCIPDDRKMNLEKGKNIFFNHTSGLAEDDGSNKTDQSKGGQFHSGWNELEQLITRYTFFFEEFTLIHSFSDHSFRLLHAPGISPEQPPDLI